MRRLLFRLIAAGVLAVALPSLLAGERFRREDSNYVSSGLVLFWQKVVSPADGPRSPSFPTGSRYAADALRRYELFTALVLTADRLVHEADVSRGPVVMIGEHEKFFDPLSFNTYWWDSARRSAIRSEISSLKAEMSRNETLFSGIATTETKNPNSRDSDVASDVDETSR